MSEYECQFCGTKRDDRAEIRAHVHWCERVESLKSMAKNGETIEPNLGTTHQFAEALSRLGTQFEELRPQYDSTNETEGSQ